MANNYMCLAAHTKLRFPKLGYYICSFRPRISWYSKLDALFHQSRVSRLISIGRRACSQWIVRRYLNEMVRSTIISKAESLGDQWVMLGAQDDAVVLWFEGRTCLTGEVATIPPISLSFFNPFCFPAN